MNPAINSGLEEQSSKHIGKKNLRRTKTKGRALNAFCRIAGTNYPIEGLPFREKFLSKKFAVIMI